MTKDEIKTLIQQRIAGQGTMVDAGGALADVLTEIVDQMGEGGGGGSLYELPVTIKYDEAKCVVTGEIDMEALRSCSQMTCVIDSPNMQQQVSSFGSVWGFSNDFYYEVVAPGGTMRGEKFTFGVPGTESSDFGGLVLEFANGVLTKIVMAGQQFVNEGGPQPT